MEIRARYMLIGLFTLAVIGAGLLFIYWLNASGGLGKRAAYRIRYDSPVSGLLKGSAVLFNGVRVGEVTALQLDAANPRDVMVAIAIDRTAPVRSDTIASIEFQGLTGAPVVSLAGGTASLPLIASTDGTVEYLRELSRLPVDAPLMLEHLKNAEEYDEGRAYIQRIAAQAGVSFA